MFNRDHTTIMSSYESVKKRMQDDNMFELEISEMRKDIVGQ
jgi:chromosomal replication initiation ATPase DnaA